MRQMEYFLSHTLIRTVIIKFKVDAKNTASQAVNVLNMYGTEKGRTRQSDDDMSDLVVIVSCIPRTCGISSS